MNNEKELIVCKCGSCEHQIILSHHDEYDCVYAEIHLCPQAFWRRLWYGIRYIFGYRCKYGAFDEIIIDPKDVDKVKRIVGWLNGHDNG